MTLDFLLLLKSDGIYTVGNVTICIFYSKTFLFFMKSKEIYIFHVLWFENLFGFETNIKTWKILLKRNKNKNTTLISWHKNKVCF